MANWRSPDDYAYLNELAPAELAWEFLRRNPDYIREYRRLLRLTGSEASASERAARKWGMPFPYRSWRRSHSAAVVWLPQLDSSAVLLAPAPAGFDARSVSTVVPRFQRQARDREYWLIGRGPGRMAMVFIEGATGMNDPASGVVPLDAAFPKRMEAMLHFWHLLHGKSRPLSLDRLTRLERERIVLKVRALDARLTGETYREIARVLLAGGIRLQDRTWNRPTTVDPGSFVWSRTEKD